MDTNVKGLNKYSSTLEDIQSPVTPLYHKPSIHDY
jgi:hypothetical protein